jgi:hypothetical protein
MAKSDGSPNNTNSPALEFETLSLDDACRFVHVRTCEYERDRGLWLRHAETARWLHWSKDFLYWVPSLHGPTFWREDYWWLDDDVLETEDLTPDTASKLIPGCIPVVAKVDKRMEAKRRKIRRDKEIASTDIQVFVAPEKLPEGFYFLDNGSRRTYQHQGNPTGHASGRVSFVEGPAYWAAYWLPGDDLNIRISRDSRHFLDKNEAQAWAIEGMRSVEKINQEVVKNETKSEETK